MGLAAAKPKTVCDRHGYRHTTGRTTLCMHPDCVARIILAIGKRSPMARGVIGFCMDDPQLWDDFIAHVLFELARKPPSYHFLAAKNVFWLGRKFMIRALKEKARDAVTEQYEVFELANFGASPNRAVVASGMYKLYAREVIAIGNRIDPVCTAHAIGLISMVDAVRLSGEKIGQYQARLERYHKDVRRHAERFDEHER